MINLRFEYGIGKGEGIIKPGTMYRNCLFAELLQKFESNFSFHRQFSPQLERQAKQTLVTIFHVDEINSLKLQNCLSPRTLPVHLPSQYCTEVEFDLKGKNFVAIGCKNKVGGYESGNAYFKNRSSLNEVSFIGMEVGKSRC